MDGKGRGAPTPLAKEPPDLSAAPEIRLPFPDGLPGHDIVVRKNGRVYVRAPASFTTMMMVFSRFGHAAFPTMAMALRKIVDSGKSIQKAEIVLRGHLLDIEPSKVVSAEPRPPSTDEEQEELDMREIKRSTPLMRWFTGDPDLADSFIQPSLFLDGVEFCTFADFVARRAFPLSEEEEKEEEERRTKKTPDDDPPPPWWSEVADQLVPMLQTMQSQMTEGLIPIHEKEKAQAEKSQQQQQE